MVGNLLRSLGRRQTRRRLGGRHPLCGVGVTSAMVPTSRPMAPSERIAVSRPEPGPLTKTSIFFMPCSIARRPAASAAICAANGVDLREPLKPTVPAEAHEITAPVGSVIVTIVLMNVLMMWASPWATFFFSLRRTFLAARVLGGISRSLRLLLAGNGALGALAGASVGLGALTADRQALAVTAALVGADLDLAADVGLDLATEVTLDLEVALDLVAELDQLGVAQLVDAGVRVDPGRGQHLLGAGSADAEDVGECDLDALVAREVHTNEACHVGLPSRAVPLGGSQRCRSCRVRSVGPIGSGRLLRRWLHPS